MAVHCGFTESRTNARVFVNPANVRAVRTADFVTGSQIVFDSAHAITVTETLEAVVRALDTASQT